MAVPFAPLLLVAGRALAGALKRPGGLLAFGGVILASGITFNVMLRQMGETALSLWPLLGLACFFFLLKEVVRAWVKIRKYEMDKEAKRES